MWNLAFSPMPGRLLRLRLLITLCRSPLDTPVSDGIPLGDSSIDRQLFEEADVPEGETYPILPTWDLSPWASDAPQRMLGAETPFSARVIAFGPQELVHLPAYARFINNSCSVSSPLEASLDVSTDILQNDANTKVPLPGEFLPAEPHQDIAHFGTQPSS